MTAIETAEELGIDTSAIPNTASSKVNKHVGLQQWHDQYADIYKAQAAWHESNDHPLAAIMFGPGEPSSMK